MTSKLTPRELSVWKGIIASGKQTGFTTDELAGFMEFTQTKKPTVDQKRKHILAIMPTICLKASSNGIQFRRTSPIGRGHEGEWGFSSNVDIRDGKKWLNDHKENA